MLKGTVGGILRDPPCKDLPNYNGSLESLHDQL